MPVDRFGNTVLMGWSEAECLWLKAAMELPRRERFEAFADISEMSGRSVAAVQSKAYALYARAVATWAPTPRVMVPGCRPDHSGYRQQWTIAQPTRAMLMAGRASCRNRTEAL